MRRIRRRDAGFNMAEVALAMFLLSLGLISLVGFFPMGLDLQRRSQDRTCATMIANTAIARVHHLSGAARFDGIGITDRGGGNWQGIFMAPATTTGQEVVSSMNNRYFVNITRTGSGTTWFWDIEIRRAYDNQGNAVTDGTPIETFKTTSDAP